MAAHVTLAPQAGSCHFGSAGGWSSSWSAGCCAGFAAAGLCIAGFLADAAGPRLSLRLDMQLAMKALRLTPVRVWWSAPNLHVSAFCAAVAAEAGLASSRRGNRAMMAMMRSMVIFPLTGLDPESR